MNVRSDEGGTLPVSRENISLPRIPVLNYHHVHCGEESFFRVTPDVLRTQMELLLAEGYVPIYPDQLIALKSSTGVKAKYVLVSFDDGYENFLLHAWPILKELKIAATIFIISDYIGGWNDWDCIRVSKHRHLNLDQLKALRDGGVAFGSHSRSHRLLVLRTNASLKAELRESQAALEELLDVKIRTLAYPGGHTNRRVCEATARYYDLGFATDADLSGSFCDPYRIPRFDPSFHQDPDSFRQALQAHAGKALDKPTRIISQTLQRLIGKRKGL
jgi:peptidoglycan/xylan/chitin deacetylase (PgdA/CDA1 family)